MHVSTGMQLKKLSLGHKTNHLIFLLLGFSAYVNGEREGVVLEKPFRMGESIAVERAKTEVERLSLPMLDIEAEINLASNVARSTQNDPTHGQIMKDLGVQRLPVMPTFLLFPQMYPKNP